MRRTTYASFVERIGKRVKTGVPGIAYFTTASNRRDGTPQKFFSVFTMTPERRRKCTRLCISTLGLEAAWHRALAIRAEYETRRMQPCR